MSRLADTVLRWLEPTPDPVVDGLMRRARSQMRAQHWDDAVATCQNAMRHAQQNGDTASQAHALLHQGRVSQLLHQPARALNHYRQAASYLHLLARDNDEAVALTLVGDLEQEEQHGQEALFNFQQAQVLVERLLARQQNAGSVTLSAQYAKRGHFLQRRIDSMAARASHDLAPLTTMIEWVPILQLPQPGQPVEDLRNHMIGAVLVGQIFIDKRAYELRPLGPPAGNFRLAPGATYYAVHVREDGWAGPDTRRDDYVLVRRARTAEEGALAAAWKDTNGLFFGRWVRREDRSVQFVAEHPEIIGGESVDVLGYVEAILRPLG
jgi:tetratricopeptide (TPR) repeat protein